MHFALLSTSSGCPCRSVHDRVQNFDGGLHTGFRIFPCGAGESADSDQARQTRHYTDINFFMLFPSGIWGSSERHTSEG